MDKIKITDELVFGYDNLMDEVDFDSEFTLRMLINSCILSEIPIEILCQIVRCNYIPLYWDEVNKDRDPEYDSGIEYLEVSWWGSKSTYNNKREDGNGWVFDGVGLTGDIPEDVAEYVSEEKLAEMISSGWRQKYAIEFTPLYNISDYVIRIDKEMSITDYDVEDYDCGDFYKKIDFTLSITLVELIYAVFYELSFIGSPEDRDSKKEELGQMAKDLKEGKIETVPWEEVKERIKKKFCSEEEG